MTPEIQEQIVTLRVMVRGVYDLQQLRMQVGHRLCVQFRAKLKKNESDEEDLVDKETGELSEKAKKIIVRLKASYRRLTEGVIKHPTLPEKEGFKGDDLIDKPTELVLVDQYVNLEKQEVKQFRQLEGTLDGVPIYDEYLKDVHGIGPAMAAVIISYLDPYKARHASQFWAYAGLDVGPDGLGRSRRAEHLVERTYKDKHGKEKTRMGVTFEPFLKTKLMGVLAGSFLRSGSEWRAVYDSYKHRLETDPNRPKVTLAEFKKRYNAGEKSISRTHWKPGRINDASKRYMVKQFLLDLWKRWRVIEGLPIDEPYSVAKLGLPPHRGEAA